MAEHTAKEYGELLIEYLKSRQLKAGPMVCKAQYGYDWNGEIAVARQKLTVHWAGEHSMEMMSDAYIVVDDMGRIRLRYEEWIAPKREDRIPERRELEILRKLQEAYYWIRFRNRESETALWFVGEYEMDTCSRVSAKKAADWVFDQLLGVLREMERTTENLGLERRRTDSREQLVFDGFEEMERFCQICRKEDLIAGSVREQAELESIFKDLSAAEGKSQKSSMGGVLGIVMENQQFRRETMEGLQIQIREEKEKQETLRQEIADLKRNNGR